MDVLQSVGLTRGESKVYHTLLHTGQTTTGTIIKKARLSSGKIYEILDRLVEKGLVTYLVKKRTKYYAAQSPERIVDYVREQEEALKQKQEQVLSVLPNLMELYADNHPEYSARIYQGKEGLENVFEAILADACKGDKLLHMGVEGKAPDAFRKLHQRCKKKGISIPRLEVRHRRGVAASFSVLNDHVLLYSWKEPAVVHVVHDEIASMFRSLHTAWRNR